MNKERMTSTSLMGQKTSVYIPYFIEDVDAATKFILYKKNEILLDCIEHPERYL